MINKLTTIRCGNLKLEWGKRTYVMGIINMSPESFSGDGVSNIETAIEQAQRFIEEGADILDVGGESTRPGLASISTQQEIDRVIPIIEQLHLRVSAPISVDTFKLEVAKQALESGASMLNDQWGLKKEPGLARLAAEKRVPIVLMSNQRDIGSFDPKAGRDTANYENVMDEVISTLRCSLDRGRKAGVPPENLIIDPGIGFGKTWKQDLEIIRRLSELKELEQPILIGPSRKSFIKMVLDLPANERMEGTAAAVAISIFNGADIVRVHDVRQMARVARMADAIVRG